MVVHAIYENGVFRPIDPVALPDPCEVDLMIQQPKQRESHGSISAPLANLAAIAGQYPENPNLPVDHAQQHDHYLYGTAKR